MNRINSYKKLGLLFLATITLLSCEVKPEPLVYGKDACYACKMILMDKKFGAEIVTKKGKVYKFDDMNCMINFHNAGNEPQENMAYILAIDFATSEKFIDAKQALYIKSNQIKSPMASQVAAFEKPEEFKAYNKTWNGILLSWGELVTAFK